MDLALLQNEPKEFEEEDPEGGPYKKGNIIKVWGNKESMNLNSMILTNILQSPYYKNHLSELTTYYEVVDEIYYRVKHLEPWEKGSRKIGGQTGMCGGVRGVGAGGIVSTPFCILYKLFTLKLTRSQLRGMIDHSDSPYIRALGFMYIRFAVPPEEFWAWFSLYLDDEEELDAKAGGGCTMSVGEMVERLLTKLDWFCTLFPRIPVPIQKKIEERMKDYRAAKLKNESDAKMITEMMQQSGAAAAGGAADGSGGNDNNAVGNSKRNGSEERPRGSPKEVEKKRERKKHRSDKSESEKHHRRRSKSRSRSTHRREPRHRKSSSSRKKHRKQHRHGDRSKSRD